MRNKYNIVISMITIIIVNIIFLPIKVETINKTFYGRDNIFNIIKQNKCKYCYNYNIDYINLIMQSIILFIIVLLILTLIDKRRNKNE